MFLLSALDRRRAGPVARSLASAAAGAAGGPCPDPAGRPRRGAGAAEPLALPPVCRGARHEDVPPRRWLTWMGGDGRALHAPPSRAVPAEPRRRTDTLRPQPAPGAAGLERRGAFLLPGRRRRAVPPRLSSANGERLPSFIFLCNGKCRSEISVCERFSEKTNIFIGTGQPANQAQNCWLLLLP